MHRGTLGGASEGEGRGAEFTLCLPLAASAESSQQTMSGRAALVPPRRVLVVDDNRDAADSLAMLLRFLGADVEIANDGPEALVAFDRYRPGVVLLDIGMPGMDGYEVARAIRERPRDERVAVVAVTGWGQEDDRKRTRDAGFDDHLVKPAELSALETLLSQAVSGRR